jgi:hypothetical protein
VKCYVTVGFNYLLYIISDLREILKKIVLQWEDCILPTHLDKCLQPVDAPKIEKLNMRLPEEDAVLWNV